MNFKIHQSKKYLTRYSLNHDISFKNNKKLKPH